VGLGYDAHRLVEGRKLMLGGVHVPFERGLFGHSDADVMAHALCDAILGAAGLGDIGRWFPDSDPAYKGASGVKLLALSAEMVRQGGYDLVNADVTLLAQRPKIAPLAAQMRENMAAALTVAPDRINVKASTTEGMGAVGREEGLAAMAVALIEQRKPGPPGPGK
jgi:2-C-methyl-D-erythritol 2,4-cyclodiphosphate synthase